MGSESRFDVVVCNQVFEHVDRPVEAVKVLFAMLKPDGLLFWSAPFNERFHLIPGDYYRFSVQGARMLLQDAGLTIVHTQRWGDSMITSGYMLGFGAGDYPPRYLEQHMLADVGENVRWLERKPNALYINVAIVAQKPGSGVAHSVNRTVAIEASTPEAGRGPGMKTKGQKKVVAKQRKALEQL